MNDEERLAKKRADEEKKEALLEMLRGLPSGWPANSKGEGLFKACLGVVRCTAASVCGAEYDRALEDGLPPVDGAMRPAVLLLRSRVESGGMTSGNEARKLTRAANLLAGLTKAEVGVLEDLGRPHELYITVVSGKDEGQVLIVPDEAYVHRVLRDTDTDEGTSVSVIRVDFDKRVAKKLIVGRRTTWSVQ